MLKSSYLKELLINEYHEKIGFKNRIEMSKSEWVYDVQGGGDYIDAAMSSLGLSDEQLLRNIAPRLSKKIKDTSTVHGRLVWTTSKRMKKCVSCYCSC